MEKREYLVRNYEDNEYGIKELQNKILEIIEYFDEFCKKNDIKYFLMGGSALGAARHKGFIPWDDDLDVALDSENYNKLLSVANKIDDGRFHFQIQNSYEQPYYFSKLRMNGTTFLDDFLKKDRNIHKGIFIDIMCFHNAPTSKVLQKKQYYIAGMLKAKANLIYGYHTKSIKKKIELFISNVVVNKFTERLLYNSVVKYDTKKCDFLGHYFGRAKFQNSVYEKKWFEKQIYVEFENLKLPIPNGINEYLSLRYGKDFMKMPSKETRKQYKAHSARWSTKIDYKEFENEKI